MGHRARIHGQLGGDQIDEIGAGKRSGSMRSADRGRLSGFS
jgi:hypothetical protein